MQGTRGRPDGSSPGGLTARHSVNATWHPSADAVGRERLVDRRVERKGSVQSGEQHNSAADRVGRDDEPQPTRRPQRGAAAASAPRILRCSSCSGCAAAPGVTKYAAGRCRANGRAQPREMRGRRSSIEWPPRLSRPIPATQMSVLVPSRTSPRHSPVAPPCCSTTSRNRSRSPLTRRSATPSRSPAFSRTPSGS
jgi:hypothetical protein